MKETNRRAFRIASVFAALAACFLIAPSALAQETCDCEDVSSSVCSTQGFRITLTAHSINQNTGISTWDYEVCNQKAGDAGCIPPKDLSHVNIDLPGLGSCLTSSQMITLTQVGGFTDATLVCGVSEKDPSCDIFGDKGTDFVAKCDVAGGNDLDPGECVTMRLSIAGEMPTLGAGVASTVTKAGRDCASDCILGPSCEPCGGPPQEIECLTRTAGFWGTHPHITNQFKPVTVCGKTLNTVDAGSCSSVTEALCVAGGKESKISPSYAQLVRQLTAAKLNLNATAANGGSCGGQIDALIMACEDLCGASESVIAASGCIPDLAAFNESQDTLATTPAPFDRPGPANSGPCRQANGNGIVIGKGSCS